MGKERMRRRRLTPFSDCVCPRIHGREKEPKEKGFILFILVHILAILSRHLCAPSP